MLQQLRAGYRAILGDVPDDDHRGSALLGKAHQGRCALAQLLRGSGARFHGAGLHGLDRIDQQQRRPLLVAQRQNRFERTVADQAEVRRTQLQALRALRRSAAWTPRPKRTAPRARARPLRRPAAAASTCRCPAHRPADSPSPTASPPPKTRSSSLMPRLSARRDFRAGGQRHRRARVARPARGRGRRPHAHQTRQRVPGTAVGALALPFQRFAPAGTADVDRLIAGHSCLV